MTLTLTAVTTSYHTLTFTHSTIHYNADILDMNICVTGSQVHFHISSRATGCKQLTKLIRASSRLTHKHCTATNYVVLLRRGKYLSMLCIHDEDAGHIVFRASDLLLLSYI